MLLFDFPRQLGSARTDLHGPDAVPQYYLLTQRLIRRPAHFGTLVPPCSRSRPDQMKPYSPTFPICPPLYDDLGPTRDCIETEHRMQRPFRCFRRFFRGRDGTVGEATDYVCPCLGSGAPPASVRLDRSRQGISPSARDVISLESASLCPVRARGRGQKHAVRERAMALQIVCK